MVSYFFNGNLCLGPALAIVLPTFGTELLLQLEKPFVGFLYSCVAAVTYAALFCMISMLDSKYLSGTKRMFYQCMIALTYFCIICKERHRYQQGNLELKEAVSNISRDLRIPLLYRRNQPKFYRAWAVDCKSFDRTHCYTMTNHPFYFSPCFLIIPPLGFLHQMQ